MDCTQQRRRATRATPLLPDDSNPGQVQTSAPSPRHLAASGSTTIHTDAQSSSVRTSTAPNHAEGGVPRDAHLPWNRESSAYHAGQLSTGRRLYSAVHIHLRPLNTAATRRVAYSWRTNRPVSSSVDYAGELRTKRLLSSTVHPGLLPLDLLQRTSSIHLQRTTNLSPISACRT